MAPTRTRKPVSTNPPSIPLARQAAAQAQRKAKVKGKKLSKGAEKARAATLREELDAGLGLLYTIRPDRTELEKQALRGEEGRRDVMTVQAEMEKMSARE